MRARTLFAVTAVALGLCACEDEQVSGEVVGPLVGPRIAESVLSLGVLDGAPVGITDVFATGEFINLWVHWQELTPPHTAEVLWFDPSGVSFPSAVEIEARVSEQVTVFTLELTQVSPTGRWTVEIFLDGEFMRSHAFLVVEVLPGD